MKKTLVVIALTSVIGVSGCSSNQPAPTLDPQITRVCDALGAVKSDLGAVADDLISSDQATPLNSDRIKMDLSVFGLATAPNSPKAMTQEMYSSLVKLENAPVIDQSFFEELSAIVTQIEPACK